MKKLFTLAAAIVLLVTGVGFALAQDSSDDSTAASTPSITDQSSTPDTSSDDMSQATPSDDDSTPAPSGD